MSITERMQLADLDSEQKETQRLYEEHILGCFRCGHGKWCQKGTTLRHDMNIAFLAWSLLEEEVEDGHHRTIAA